MDTNVPLNNDYYSVEGLLEKFSVDEKVDLMQAKTKKESKSFSQSKDYTKCVFMSMIGLCFNQNS